MKETGTIFLIFYVFCIGICEAQWTSGGLLLSPDTNHHYRSKQAPHPSGGIYIAWEDITPANDNSIRLHALDPDGNIPVSWPSGGAKITSEGNHYAPVVCTTSDSSVIVAWYGVIPSVSSNEHIWVQKYSHDGTALWNSGNPVMISQTDTFHHKYPLLAADDNGGAYIVWTRYSLDIQASSPDLVLQHLLDNGTLDNAWSSGDNLIAGIQGTREYYPRIVVSNDNHKIYVLYAQGLIGNTSMRLQKAYTQNGLKDATWPAEGIILSPGGDVWASLDCEQYLFADSSDNVVSFWLESKISANGEIYMQKTDSAGNILLSSGGIRVGGTITDGTGYVSIVSDKNSNYFLAYNNYANWYDITAKKIDNSGTQIWFNQWVTNDGNSAYPQITLNDNGGIYVFYKRLSPSPTTLYAVSLDAQGEITGGWAVPGSSFGNVGTYNGMFPHRDFCVAAGTSGNAFAVWDRLTGGLYKLYACNLFPSGMNCSPTTQLPETAHAHEIKVFPNPVEQYLNIDCTGIKGCITMQLFSVYGQVVSETMLISGENRICLPELSNGPYIIFIHSDRLTIYQSVILKH
jgi:hypothetical protein